MSGDVQPSLGSILRATRQANRITLKDIERATGISNAYLSQLETGKIASPTPERLGLLATGYGLPVGTLLHLAGVDVQEWKRTENLPVPDYIKAAADVFQPEDWEALRGTVEWMLARRLAPAPEPQ